MSITALIDGDWILYAAGFAGQRKELVAVHATGHADGPFPNITALKVALDGTPEDTYDVFSRDLLDDERNFYHSAKMMIAGNCNKIADRFGEDVIPRIIMDGDGNFRTRIATIRPYKGTRGVHAKPLMYNEIRQYLLDAWKAEVVYDQETDDEMAIIQTEMTAAKEKCIIVAVDKDMLQVPGWHLNPNKGFKKVSKAGGLLRLYIQAAQGDPVDNIAGAYKVGPKAARDIFTIAEDELVMWDALVYLYQTSIYKYPDENLYNGLCAEEAALENMRLVYLRRERGETWNPPGV